MTPSPLAGLFVQAALTIAMPLALWVWAGRRSRLGRHGMAMIGYGCLFFGLSQVISTPIRVAVVMAGVGAGPLQGALFALISAVGEESIRWFAMSKVGQIREALDRRAALLYGLGHGGFESVLIGLGVLATALIVRNAGDAGALSQVPGLAAQAASIEATPWYVFLAGVLERALAIASQVGLSLIVMRAVVAAQPRFLLLAIAVHAGTNGIAIALQSTFGRVALTEAWLALASIAALGYGVAAGVSSRLPAEVEGATEGVSS